jgi:hypothetical protein
MSIQAKVAIVLAAVSVSALGMASGALAGEGGAAGSAAFTINEGSVTGVAVSAAIGKQDAFAGAFNDGTTGDNTAFALGSAGTISVSTLESMSVGLLSSESDPALGTAQANNFAANTSVQIGTGDGDKVVEITPAP